MYSPANDDRKAESTNPQPDLHPRAERQHVINIVRPSKKVAPASRATILINQVAKNKQNEISLYTE